MQENRQWKYVIDPENRRLEFRFREVWQYRELIFLFVKRDFVSQYKQMRLGALWAIINPVTDTIVFNVVYGNLAKLTTLDSESSGNIIIPSFLFYMIGNILWSYFTNTVNSISRTFIQNTGIMGKVYYPRLVSPISAALSGVITEVIRLILFFVLMLVFIANGSAVLHPSPFLLLFPLLMLQIMLLGIGGGLIVSATTTKYRDATRMLSFVLRLGMYGTPVVYGLQLVPKKLLPLYMLNPLTPIITTARYICFGDGYFRIQYCLFSWFVSVLVFLLGVVAFNRAEKNFVDRV